MSNNTFTNNAEDFLKLTYLAPLPLVAPPGSLQPLDSFNDEPTPQAKRNNRTKNWTIGTCVAMSTGGILALGAWFYRRRAQDKRAVEVADEHSEPPESVYAAQKELLDDA